VVVVGSGPVGVRAASEIHRRVPELPIVLYGAEPLEPYDRVRLSSFLAGELGWEALTRDLDLPASPTVERRFGCAVRSIDRGARLVRDAAGREQPYSKLVLATGSTPHVPEIEGIDLAGVYTFRDFADVQKLFARRTRSRRTVVLGGGLLGLESARAMLRFHTEVIVVEHSGRLLARQLDGESAGVLQKHVEAMGIAVVNGDGVRRVLGDGRVAGVELVSGARIECDTIVVATGIRPNIDLARRAELAFGRGIRVDDAMRTSDPDVLAIGECAEHRGRLYGLVAPGLEQAAVAAAVIAGDRAVYRGSHLVTRLKVVGVPVFSAGRVTEEEIGNRARVRTYRSPGADACCKLVTERGRVVGASMVGSSDDPGRLQEAVARGRLLWPWHLRRFRSTGRPWSDEESESVADWPGGATVCNCTGVTRGTLSQAIARGCGSVDALAAATRASTVCGSCRPLLSDLVDAGAPAEPVRGATWLLGASVLAALAAITFLLPVDLPYAASVPAAPPWDALWRESFWKQASGYAVLALGAAALLLSLRKRIPMLRYGDFASWRVVHVVVGGLSLAALVAHTGGRLGSNLDRALMASLLAVIAAGAWSAVVVAREHAIGRAAVRLRRRSVWLHVLLFWPIPALLTFHVLKAYYF
jgi:nitrite reductase (NADH) large subunit